MNVLLGSHSSGPSVELEKALSIANAFLTTLDRDPKDLTERSRIPTKEHPLVGLGGGLFIEVDRDKKKATFLGVGE